MPIVWGSLRFAAAPWLAVSFGGGTNSSAMLCGLYKLGIKPDVIIFADTGAEMPHTNAHVLEMRVRAGRWWGLDIVRVTPKTTIVEHCDKTAMLPSLAYGRRSCSQKFKHEPMEKCLKEWAKENGATEIVKAIGYGAEEGYRVNGKPTEKQLCKGLREQYVYPLVEWQWRREDCVKAIKCAGLTQPGKSSCYFCPGSKRSEVIALKQHYPELLERALEIEANSQKRHRTKIGLGGMGNLWSDWLAMDEAQIKMMLDIEPHEIPCGCLDG